jgi:hypothetical protein
LLSGGRSICAETFDHGAHHVEAVSFCEIPKRFMVGDKQAFLSRDLLYLFDDPCI